MIGCKKKKVVVPEEEQPSKPEYKIGYTIRCKEYRPGTNPIAGSQDSVSFVIKTEGKSLMDIKLKTATINLPLYLTGQDSIRTGDVVEFTTTAIIRTPSVTVCTFKTDSTWIQNKNGLIKLKGADTYTMPVTYTNGKAIVSYKRQFTIN